MRKDGAVQTDHPPRLSQRDALRRSISRNGIATDANTSPRKKPRMCAGYAPSRDGSTAAPTASAGRIPVATDASNSKRPAALPSGWLSSWAGFFRPAPVNRQKLREPNNRGVRVPTPPIASTSRG